MRRQIGLGGGVIVLALGLLWWLNPSNDAAPGHQPGTVHERAALIRDPSANTDSEAIKQLAARVSILTDTVQKERDTLQAERRKAEQRERKLQATVNKLERTETRIRAELDRLDAKARQPKVISTEVVALRQDLAALRVKVQKQQQKAADAPTLVPTLPKGPPPQGTEPLPALALASRLPGARRTELAGSTPEAPPLGYTILRSTAAKTPTASTRSTLRGRFDRLTDRVTGSISSAPGYQTVAGTATAKAKAKAKAEPIPVYTLAPDSEVKTRSLTALFGIVPQRGQVSDPYRFKLLVDRWSLAANDHPNAPALFGAMMSGIAIGDYALSCVRGKITSFTFIFEDGTITHVPGTVQKPLGVIKDAVGSCPRGERIDNIKEYAVNRGLLAAAEAAARAWAADQTSAVTSGALGTTTTIIDGDTAKFAAGHFLSGATREWSDVLDEVMEVGDIVIAVPPNQALIVDIQQMIPIDYDPNGRKLTYAQDTLHPFTELD